MTERDGQQGANNEDYDFDGLEFSAMTTGTMHICRVLKAIRPKKPKSNQYVTDQPDLLAKEHNTFVVVTITSQGLAFSVGEMHTGLGMNNGRV